MASKDLENKAGNRLFENPILEALTKSTPSLIMATYLPIIAGLVWYGYYNGSVTTIGEGVGLFLMGFVSWTLFEYLMHRFIFHSMQGKPQYQRVYQLMHGMHHDHPKDPQRLFMPPVAGIALVFLFFCLFFPILWSYTYLFLPGFVLGYLTYVMTHYAMHRYQPPFKFLEPLWKHHHMHHFRHPDLAFGVSNFFWDRVFGTMPTTPKKKGESQEKMAA